MNVGPSRIETLNSALSTVTLTTLERGNVTFIGLGEKRVRPPTVSVPFILRRRSEISKSGASDCFASLHRSSIAVRAPVINIVSRQNQ